MFPRGKKGGVWAPQSLIMIVAATAWTSTDSFPGVFFLFADYRVGLAGFLVNQRCLTIFFTLIIWEFEFFKRVGKTKHTNYKMSLNDRFFV